MRPTRSTIIGAAALGLGLLIGLFPMISVWRLSGDVLGQLPELAAAEVNDDRHRFAVADSDFVLATRTYQGATPTEVDAALDEAGFESTSARGELYLFKPCCGAYDAVWAQVSNAGDGATEVSLTVADSDIQTTWVLFAVFGSLLVLFGIIVLKGSLLRSTRLKSRSESSSEASSSGPATETVHEPV